jgi:uncharacterized membrane protein
MLRWNQSYTIKSYLKSTIWVTPFLAFLLEQILFRTMWEFQIDFGWFPGMATNKEGAIAAADYAIAATIAFIVFTFSSLLVAIQVASAQLTPRIIATTLLRDRTIRWAVALFCFEMLLAVSIKVRVDTVPISLVSLMALFGLLSVIMFLFLIDYAARFLRPINILWRVSEAGLKVIEDVYPQQLSPSYQPPSTVQKLGPPDRTILHRGTSAIVIAVNLEALLAAARRSNCVIEFIPRVGDFVGRGDPLLIVRGSNAADIDEVALRGQVAFGRERTIEQDTTFAFRVIVDIAIKALSKAINDPTTAVIAIDQLQRLLRVVGTRVLHDERILDSDGQLRLIARTPNWPDFVQLSCREVRHYGSESLQVARRLRAMIETVMQSLPEVRQPALQRELDLLDRALRQQYQFAEDLALACVADTQGLGGSSVPE